LSGASERFFACIGSCLTNKHYTILERRARDKYSGLSRKFVTYGRKKFNNIWPCASPKVLSSSGTEIRLKKCLLALVLVITKYFFQRIMNVLHEGGKMFFALMIHNHML
jgi:hypothetical protein